MKTENREVFVSDDGKVFETIEACQAYEKQIAENAKRIAGLKVYSVSSGFDATEGRGYFHNTYIITDAGYMIVLEYCLDRWGKPLSSWYGDSFYQAWIIREHTISADEALKDAKRLDGQHRVKVDAVFLSSRSIDHPELPKPVYPWPKKALAKAGVK